MSKKKENENVELIGNVTTKPVDTEYPESRDELIEIIERQKSTIETLAMQMAENINAINKANEKINSKERDIAKLAEQNKSLSKTLDRLRNIMAAEINIMNMIVNDEDEIEIDNDDFTAVNTEIYGMIKTLRGDLNKTESMLKITSQQLAELASDVFNHEPDGEPYPGDENNNDCGTCDNCCPKCFMTFEQANKKYIDDLFKGTVIKTGVRIPVINVRNGKRETLISTTNIDEAGTKYLMRALGYIPLI